MDSGENGCEKGFAHQRGLHFMAEAGAEDFFGHADGGFALDGREATAGGAVDGDAEP